MGILVSRQKELEKYVTKTDYARVGVKTTVCCLTLYNGFEVIGTSACVDPKNFNKELGEVYAREDAFEELDRFIGFYEQELEHQEEIRYSLDVDDALKAIERSRKYY